MSMGCEKPWFGWPCDKDYEALRTSWAFAPDLAARKRIAAEISRKASELVPDIHFSQWRNPIAYRAGKLSGVIVTPSLPPMWNIEKK